MLEHVAPNQTRFVAPGLSPDNRGVALGRFVAVLLPSIDRVVGLFRGLSEALSLDELLPSLKIIQVRTPLQSREFVVQIPVSNSYAADQIAAVAALAGGLTFTGSAKHFVKYRDSRSPLGHDVDSLYGGQGDLILYGADFVQAYVRDRDLAFSHLALTLSLQPDRGDVLREGEEALVRVVPGLWRSVLGYLHRSNVACSAAAAEIGDDAVAGPERFYLVRCQGLPPRMADLFCTTPGLELMRIKLERVAVQLGYRHPIELTSCSTIFSGERFYLFSGDRDRVDTLVDQPVFVDAASLVQIDQPQRPLPAMEARATEAGGVRVPLRLVSVAGATPRVAAARIPIEQGAWLKKLVYLLPPAVLSSYSVCVTDRWIFLLNEAGIDLIPLGEMFYATAPGVMVPLGYQLIPRVHPDVLLQHLEASAQRLFFFTRDDPRPLALERGAFEPLGRMSLAQVDVRRPPAGERNAPEPMEPEIVNRPTGIFPLWGFSGGLEPDGEGD